MNALVAPLCKEFAAPVLVSCLCVFQVSISKWNHCYWVIRLMLETCASQMTNLISAFDPDRVSISLNFHFLNQQKKRKKENIYCSVFYLGEKSLRMRFFLTCLFSFCIRVLTKLHIFPSLSSSPSQKIGQMHEFSWTWLPPSPWPSNICSQRITISAFTPHSDRAFLALSCGFALWNSMYFS